MKNLKFTRLAVLLLSVALLIAGIVGITASADKSAPSLEIFSKNLSYGGTISIAFAVDAQNVDADAVELLVYKSEPTEGSTPNHTVKTYEVSTVYEREALVFLTPGIAAKDMTQEIYVKAHAVVNGVDVYSETERYSIAEYAFDMQFRSKINENFIKLGAALLEVGEQIQTLLEYNVNNSPMDLVYISVEEGTVDGKYSSGLFKKGEDVTLTYNGTAPEGKVAIWDSEAGSVKNGVAFKAESHAFYTAKFQDKHVPGVYYGDSTKDGTRYDDAMTATGADALLGISNNAYAEFEPGATYIVETDFTYNGGTYKSQYPAFFGFQATNALDNKNMFFGTYIEYPYENASTVSILGAELTKGVTYNIRFEYTVGAGDYTTGSGTGASASQKEYIRSCLKFFVNGKEIELPDDADLMIGQNLRDSANADRRFWGLGLKVRSSTYASSDFSVTFDNTYIAPKATVTADIDSYYANKKFTGARLDFSESEDLDGIVVDSSHTSNEGRGSATIVDGALKIANNPAWYGLLFKNPTYSPSTSYANGTKYIFEADITYNGGASKHATDKGAAFVGFVTREYGTDIRNTDMAGSTHAKYENSDALLDLFGADFANGATHKLTVVYTVGTRGSIEVYIDLVGLGSYSLTDSASVADTVCAGFGFYFRGTNYTDQLELTFDNVFVGVIEAE